jgi:hypothetical protein
VWPLDSNIKGFLYIALMTILAYAPNYLPQYAAGDTVMLHEIITYLQSQGHDCTVMLPKLSEPYEYNGVKVIPRQAGLFNKVDLILTQLDCTRETLQLSKGKPVIWIQHNTFGYPSVYASDCGVIYNGEASKDAMGWDNDGFVLPPPVWTDKYEQSTGAAITLINCNENKGGKILDRIARAMPHKQFIAVKGAYGEQFAPDLPNVLVIEHTSDMRPIYANTRILIMPSLYESWGRVATEAMSCGIPVIATPTFGLIENIGKGGIFVRRENIDQWMDAIKKLDGKKEYEEAQAYSRKRAMELQPGKKLEQMHGWIKEFVKKKTEKHGIQHN